MKQPLVSVIMPVYNAERYLKEAMDSILGQTYGNFELIAIDDGSTDGSKELLEQLAKKDPRVQATYHKKNMGLVKTLNEGLELSRGEYIARMDSDDISLLTRFQQQVDVLQKHEQTVLVASGFEVIDEQGEFLYREVVPTKDRDIKRAMLLRNPIAHGSVMFRKSAYEQVGGYSGACGPTEDFELWSRLSVVGDFQALEASVFRWRINTQGISSNSNKLQLEIMKRHTAALWASAPPVVLSSAELRATGRTYFGTYKKRGFDMRNIVFSDNVQIAFGMIRRGRPLLGVKQFFAVATSTRTGLKVACRRLKISLVGNAKGAIRRYAKYGRQET